MQNFFDLPREKLEEIIGKQFKAKPYVAGQLFDWVYRKEVTDFDEMTNISKSLREEFKKTFIFKFAKNVEKEVSSDGTRKYVLAVPSGQTIETVLINQPNRKTICVSSQYGCGMGCTFCKTGTMGFIANLTTGDIISQVLAIKKDCKKYGDTFLNMVFMGMGEPLHNFKGIVGAIKILTDPLGFEMAPKRITVSTVGLVPAIKKFGEADLGVNLAVSLNATTDEVRSKIMPINKNYPIDVLLSTLKKFPLSGKKRITIEYVMLAGVNDTQHDMTRLAKILKGLKCKINLIPYNDNAGLGFSTPSRNKVYLWQKQLTELHYDTMIRWSKGNDINAACGQLVTQVVKKQGKLKQAE